MASEKVFSLDDLIQGTGGSALQTSAAFYSGIGTDTRKDLSGQIFFALKGDRFDAHDYLDQAVKAGASALVIHENSRARELSKAGVTIIETPDTLRALQKFASYWRKKNSALVLGITGSNGKTSTKEFAARIIGSSRKTHWSRGSFNNHWGVPLTLLDLRPYHEVALVEMGMNHAGELTELSRIAQPDVVVCTMVGSAHQGFFGSVDAIAAAKEEIYIAAIDSAVGVFNLDNSYTRQMHQRWSVQRPNAKAWTFSETNSAADVRFSIKEMAIEGLLIQGTIQNVSGEVRVPVFGRQNLTNLMAAATLGLAAGLKSEQIWPALATCQSAWGRNQWLGLSSPAVRILFDGYNSNLESAGALLANTAELKGVGAKHAVLGDILEMGDWTDGVHERLGALAAQSGLAQIWYVGKQASAFKKGFTAAKGTAVLNATEEPDRDAAARFLQSMSPGDLVILKASRGVGLEKVLSHWGLSV